MMKKKKLLLSRARFGAVALMVVSLAGVAGLAAASPSAGALTGPKEYLHTGIQTFTQAGWAKLVLEDGDWPVTANNITVLLQWMGSENFPTKWWGPTWTPTTKTYLPTPSRNNPLNCGQTANGTPEVAGTWSYPNLARSAYEVVYNLYTTWTGRGTAYAAIRADLARGATPKTTAKAIWASPWDVGGYDTGADWYGVVTGTYTTATPPRVTFNNATDWDSPQAVSVTSAPGVDGYTQEVYAVTTSGTIWQKSLKDGQWYGWYNLDGSGFTGTVDEAPGVLGSTQEIFAISGGQVYANWVTKSKWNGWVSMDGSTFASVTWAPGSNGSLQELFGIEQDGSVYVDWENTNGTWSGWVQEAGSMAGFSDVSVATGSNGSLQELFGINQGSVMVTWENPGGAWTPWMPMGSQQGLSFSGSITVAPGSNGSLQEIFVESSGNVYVKWENPGGAWSAWASQSEPTGGDVTSTTVAPGSNGSLQELLAVAAGGKPYVKWENPGGAWSGWMYLGGWTVTGSIVYGTKTQDVTQYFYVVAGHTIYEDEETRGVWSGWQS